MPPLFSIAHLGNDLLKSYRVLVAVELAGADVGASIGVFGGGGWLQRARTRSLIRVERVRASNACVSACAYKLVSTPNWCTPPLYG